MTGYVRVTRWFRVADNDNNELILRDVRTYLLHFYHERDLTLNDYCMDSGKDRRAVQRALEKCQTTWRTELISRRMKQALMLVTKSSKSVRAIATDVGYGDPGYFSKQFRKVYHQSPLQVRKEARRALK